MRKLTNIFLNLEEKARTRFEKFPFFHAFLAGVGVVLFWRGVWETSDHLGISSVWSIILGTLLLIILGLFLQTLVGNTIIIKKVENEKKTEQKDIAKVEKEVNVEEITLEILAKKLESIEVKIENLKK